MKLFFVILILMASGCAAVQPYEREALSKTIMQFDYDKDEAAAREHFLNSLEGSSGGYGVGGGGCGCN